jgi:hypothetical protein
MPLPYPTTRTPRTPRGTGGWILTAKLAFFVASGFASFVGESRPSSRRYPAKSVRDFPGKVRRDLRGPLGGL